MSVALCVVPDVGANGYLSAGGECIAGVLNGDSHVSSAGAFVKTYAARLDPSQGCSFMLGLLCFQTSSQAPKAAMPPVMKCAMTAAPAIASRAFTQAPKQWHEAVLAEIKRLLSATPDCSSLALSMQTGGHNTCGILSFV